MFNHSTKKRHLEINHLPENIANFYSKITHFEYNHEQVMSILKHPSFQLNQDIPFTQEAYSPYHDHSFETPLLAICHYASQHAYDISDEELLDIIEQFVDLKANVNAKDQWQDTPLLLLSMTDNDKWPYTTSIQSLIKHGANIQEKNQNGSSTQSVLKEKLSHPITMTERALELILSINDRAERSEIAFKETIIQLLFEYMEKTLLESSNTVTNTSIEPITRRNNL